MNFSGIETEEAVNRINEDIRNLTFRDGADGEPQSLACFCCEKLMLNEKKIYMKLSTVKELKGLFVARKEDVVPAEAIVDYCYKGKGRKNWMKGMLISKYCCYRSKDCSFLTCSGCYGQLRVGKYPLRGIRNGNFCGYAPIELEELNDIELSFICPVRISGHIFTYFGGAKGIKGWHSLLKCDLQNVARSLHGMDRLGMANRIAIVLSGPMTVLQKKHIQKKSFVRRDKCYAALKKLCSMNVMTQKEFEDFDFDSIPDPILIDRTSNLEGEVVESNVELREEFTVVFPDSSLNDTYGGFKTVKDFKRVVDEVNGAGASNLVLQCKAVDYAVDYADDNFVKAFPKQFPYGRGGPKENRIKNNGDVYSMPLTDYLVHINGLANPHFHSQMFTVVCYNMLQRQKMVQKACWRLKSKDQVMTKIASVTDQEIKERVATKKAGLRRGTLAAVEFIDLVDVITGSLPHSNKAAKVARGDGLAMQVEFGTPAIFLTVTPNDANSYIIQIYSGIKSMNHRCITDMSVDEIAMLATEKNTLRITYPGVCAVWFEAVLNIVLKHVIGWDMDKKEATKEGGCYGIPEAVFAAIEEQSRKCLHGHLIIFLKNYNRVLRDLQSKRNQTARKAQKELMELHNRVASNSLMPKPTPEMFQHGPACKDVKPDEKRLPALVCLQDLRSLRHKEGCKVLQGIIAECTECRTQWSSEEMAFSYLRGVAGEGVLGTILETMASEGRIRMSELDHLLFDDSTVINRNEREILTNAIYNLHGSAHVKQCFSKSCECRFNYPKCPVLKTELVCVSQIENWVSWSGKDCHYKQYEIESKRNEYDVFMNQYSPPISRSLIASNSNARLLTDGRAGYYATSYTAKETQEEDTGEYQKVLNFTQRRMYEARYDSEFSESLSRLLGASFAHSSSNVISPWLAKYLIRNGTRFLMSHQTVIVPCFDMEKVLEGGECTHYVKRHGDDQFSDSAPHQYMYRPEELESVTQIDFFVEYNMIRKHGTNMKGMFIYRDEAYAGTGYMGVKESKEKNRIAKFHTHFIPDATTFRSDILKAAECDLNAAMELYAKRVMIIYCHYRTLDDLKLDGSYVKMFQEWTRTVNFSEKIEQSLSNIQDMKNMNKLSRKPDALEAETIPYKPNEKRKKEEDDSCDLVPEDFIQSLVTDYVDESYFSAPRPVHENTLDMSDLMLRGAKGCGIKNVARTKVETSGLPFIEKEIDDSPVQDRKNNDDSPKYERDRATKSMAIQLIGMRVERVVKNHAGTGKPGIDVTANGTVESIVKWCTHMVAFDSDQRRSFEILAGRFVLTYFDETTDDVEADDIGIRTTRGALKKERKRLRAMVGKQRQLLLFLTGPGGSGKSEVVKQLLLYAIEFCNYLGVAFTEKTILVTAMSGVAATLINGETLHTAVHLMFQLKNITEEMMNAFQSVRLLIIDEISFASVEDVRKLDLVLRDLKQAQGEKYGGLDIAFMGDFSQIPSVQSPRLYEDPNCHQWHQWINCFIQLNGRWRYKDDPAYGETCWRFHEGKPLPDDFEAINSRCVDRIEGGLPDGITYAVHLNKDRDAINTATFMKHLDDHTAAGCLLVLASEVQVVSKRNGEKPMKDLLTFWSKCGESDARTTRSRLDPALKLYPGCPVMLLANKCVREGEANGTQGTVEAVMLKNSANLFDMQLNDHCVQAVLASDVAYLRVKIILGDQRLVRNIEIKDFTFDCKYPVPTEFAMDSKGRQKIKMKASQFPVVSNTATTGHKLQGSTKTSLYVPFWQYGIPNWPYVMISRVRTLAGLYVGLPLDPNMDYTIDHRILRMLNNFRQYTPEPFSMDDLGFIY